MFKKLNIRYVFRWADIFVTYIYIFCKGVLFCKVLFCLQRRNKQRQGTGSRERFNVTGRPNGLTGPIG